MLRRFPFLRESFLSLKNTGHVRFSLVQVGHSVFNGKNPSQLCEPKGRSARSLINNAHRTAARVASSLTRPVNIDIASVEDYLCGVALRC